MSLARVENLEVALDMIARLEKEFKPTSFLLKEIYFSARERANPLEVREVIPFGACPPELAALPPYFGPTSFGDPKVSYRSVDDLLSSNVFE